MAGINPLYAMLGGTALGALSSAFGNSQSQTRSIGPQTALGRQAENTVSTNLEGLESLVGMGPGGAQVQGALNSQQDLISLLQQFAQGGYLPTEENFQTANKQADAAFAPQMEGLNQFFEQSRVDNSRLAGQLGRPLNDPILQNKLAQTQGNALNSVLANKQAFGSQLAYQMPMQQLGFASQANQLQQGLATQALQNRANLLSQGNSILSGQNNLRTAQSTVTNNQPVNFGTILSGGVAGAGMGLQSYGLLNSLNGFGGGNNQPVPTRYYVGNGAVAQ